MKSSKCCFGILFLYFDFTIRRLKGLKCMLDFKKTKWGCNLNWNKHEILEWRLYLKTRLRVHWNLTNRFLEKFGLFEFKDFWSDIIKFTGVGLNSW